MADATKPSPRREVETWLRTNHLEALEQMADLRGGISLESLIQDYAMRGCSLRFDPATVSRLRWLASAGVLVECRSLLLKRAEEARATGSHDLAASLLAVAEEIQALSPPPSADSYSLPS